MRAKRKTHSMGVHSVPWPPSFHVGLMDVVHQTRRNSSWNVGILSAQTTHKLKTWNCTQENKQHEHHFSSFHFSRYHALGPNSHTCPIHENTIKGITITCPVDVRDLSCDWLLGILSALTHGARVWYFAFRPAGPRKHLIKCARLQND